MISEPSRLVIGKYGKYSYSDWGVNKINPADRELEIHDLRTHYLGDDPNFINIKGLSDGELVKFHSQAQRIHNHSIYSAYSIDGKVVPLETIKNQCITDFLNREVAVKKEEADIARLTEEALIEAVDITASK